MRDPELVREILEQILVAAQRIMRRFEPIQEPDDFLDSEAGIDRLDAIGMMLIAIGESVKHLDKITDRVLLKQYQQVDWSGAMGVRDVLSHHYFDLNADVIFSICRKRIPQLIETVETMIQDLEDGPA
jgi:uncharacterized protein with HEPN domain